MDERLILAIDIGGTKLEVGLVADDGTIVDRRRTTTRATGTGDELFGDLVELLGDLPARAVVCGVGTGGPMTRGGATVSPVNIPAWRDFPLLARLEAATGLPVRIDNDAKALALGEGWLGAAVGERNYLALVVSTGVGGGIVLDGRLLDGADGNAGHVGWVWVGEEGTPWPEHVPGQLEAEASGTGIAHRLGTPAADAPPDEVARTGRLVGRGVASVANLLDLRLAVVAGSVALGYGEPFFRAAQTEVDRLCVLPYSRGARIVPAGLGADGPLIGAAAVGRSIG